MFKVGSYEVCFLDLITDAKTGKLSSVKMWRHVGYGTIIYKFPPEPSLEYLLAFAAIFIVDNGLTSFLKYKYRDGAENAAKPIEP